MNTRFVCISALLLVATLFIAPAVAGFVTPLKPESPGNAFNLPSGSPGNSGSYTAQWRNLDGINPNDPSTMTPLAKEIKKLKLRPSPQRPFSWTPTCTV